MKIWILEIGEPLPLEKYVRLHRYGQFVKFLSECQHEVTWWTSSFSHTPKRHLVEKDCDVDYFGSTVRLLRGLGYKKNISFARIQHNRHFARRFLELAPLYPKPDLIIAPVPTIEIARAGVQFALQKNIPVLTDIRDEWPDELKNIAPPPLRPIARLLLCRAYQQMKYVCRHASGIMAVTEKQLEYALTFAQRRRQDQDLIFPLGYPNLQFSKENIDSGLQWCESAGMNARAFIVCFFGTIGKFFNLELVIRAARILEKKMPIQIVLAGDGSSLERYRQMALNRPSVIFPGWVDSVKIVSIMKLSKVGLAPYRPKAAMSLPNKAFEYMSGKLAIVSSIQNELKTVLETHRCGLTYQPNSCEDLAEKIFHLYQNETLRAEMGRNAYSLFQNKFSTEVIFKEVNRHLNQVIGGGLIRQ